MIPTRGQNGGARCGAIYVVEPSARECDSLVELLGDLDRPVVDVPSAEALLAAIPHDRPACVIADFELPGRSGLELLAALRARRPAVPTILIGEHGNVRGAVEALRGGAKDFFEKPLRRRALHAAVASIVRARSDTIDAEHPEELETI